MTLTTFSHTSASRRHVDPGVALLLVALAACGSEGEPKSNGTPLGGSGGSAQASSNGAGPAPVAASSSSSAAGSGGGTTSSGTGGAVIAPACDGNYAYWATNTSFTFPTAQPLAAAFNELTYDFFTQPLSLVIVKKGKDFTGTVSATESGDGGLEQLLSGTTPDFVALTTKTEEFATTGTQPKGYLRLKDMQGPVVIELRELKWQAKIDTCDELWVTIDASLPSSAGGTVLHLKNSSPKLSDLLPPPPSPPPGGGETGWAIHLSFVGESMSFDFASVGSP